MDFVILAKKCKYLGWLKRKQTENNKTKGTLVQERG